MVVASSQEKPLADASRRLSGRGINPGVVIGMAAAGIPKGKIAQVLGKGPETISDALRVIPNSSELIAKYREALKVTKIQRAHAVEEPLWRRISKEISTGNAKDVDALMRAAHASEKIQAQVAGEGQRVDVTGLPQNPVADIKVLIQAIIDRQ